MPVKAFPSYGNFPRWIGITAFVAVQIAFLAICARGDEAKDAEARHAGEQFFERKIRPVLIQHCHKCHSGEHQKGSLKVDSLASLLAGGDSGAAVVPGDAQHSLIVDALEYSEDFVQMPPSKQLPPEVVADFKTWIGMGAPWPGASPGDSASLPVKSSMEITDKDRSWWAFVPVRNTKPSPPQDTDWSQSPIDAFIRARLEAGHVTPNPLASKRELCRRAYFDLIGLPPTPEEVRQFEQDDRPDAFARLVNALLARPQYGERWARHWLDVVRYAQTNGYERDSEKPYAWRYRDYVIHSLNENKPYDQFIIEQLAGDLIPDGDDESLIATGFYRLGVWDDEPDDARMAEFDVLDDVMVATSAAFLGVTVGCARCHDHKFDPIPQADYYRLLANVRSVRGYEKPRFAENSPSFIPLGDRRTAEQRFAQIRSAIQPLEEQLAKTEKEAEKKKLRERIDRVTQDSTGPMQWALVAREGKLQPTHVLIRGNAGTPGDEVRPGFLQVLDHALPAPIDGSAAASSPRLNFARWIADPRNPLTARVLVNRVWKHHFGRGIVRTTSDFGRGGMLPTHPELLDWLARDFVESGWSMKRLHRQIMLSRTYRLSSAFNDEAAAKDPNNDLFWRNELRRLEAESIRDAILAVSGALNPAMGGRGFFPRLAGEVLAGGSRPGDGWEVSPPQETNRRSIYAFIKRSMLPPLLEGFDYATTASPLAERQVTTVAPQALMLLNDQFMQDQAKLFAQRVADKAGDDPQHRLDWAYLLAIGREPTSAEREVARQYLDAQTQAYRAIESRLTFSPDVPVSLHRSYLDRLQAHEFLLGPRAGWSYYRGQWTGGYEGILTLDRRRGPFALWQGPAFADGTIETRVTLDNAIELGSIIFRATAEGTLFRGYEVMFEPREPSVSLWRHGAEVTLLGRTEVDLPANTPLNVRIDTRGARVQVWLGESSQPVLDLTDPQPLQDAGRLGARAWGASFSLDQPMLRIGGRSIDVLTAGLDPNTAAESPEPPAGWKQYGGAWMVENTAYRAEPSPGAKVIWTESTIADGVVEADVRLDGSQGDGGIVLRVNQPTEGVDSLFAYNINFQANALRLGKHANNWKQLARVPMNFADGKDHHLRVELHGGRVRITVDQADKPQIDYTDDQPLPPGSVGLRTFNARMSVKNLKVTNGSDSQVADLRPMRRLAPAEPGQESVTPEDRAWASWCLVMFNLNEFVYID